MTASVIDVSKIINESPISRFQYVIFATCVLIMMCDGFDTQAVAYVAPSIVAEWKLAPGSFGPAFSAALLGAMAGAFAVLALVIGGGCATGSLGAGRLLCQPAMRAILPKS